MTNGSLTRCECGMVRCDGYALHDLRMQGNKDRAALERVARQDQREAALKDKDLAEREARHARIEEAARKAAARNATEEPDTPADGLTFADFGQAVTLLDVERLPSAFERVDGETLLYEGLANTIYGEPSSQSNLI